MYLLHSLGGRHTPGYLSKLHEMYTYHIVWVAGYLSKLLYTCTTYFIVWVAGYLSKLLYTCTYLIVWVAGYLSKLLYTCTYLIVWMADTLQEHVKDLQVPELSVGVMDGVVEE